MKFTVAYKALGRWERVQFKSRRDAEAYAARVTVAFRAEFVQVRER